MTHHIGTAIQLGLMALDGYFTGSLVPEPDWEIREISDRGPCEFYRYGVVGQNHAMGPSEAPSPFFWHVPTIGWRFYYAPDAARFV